jgi:hypothetical protein
VRVLLSIGVLCGFACFGQQWEFGAAGGYGLYHNGSVLAPGGAIQAGVKNRFAVSASVTENLYEHISGEARYTYQDGDPFLAGRGFKTLVAGQSHAFHYDVLFHFRRIQEKTRPFLAVGAGAKLYRVSGPPNPDQPLSGIAVLTTRDDFRVLVTAGAGIERKLGRYAALRLDFRDYMTPFPKTLIHAAPLNTPRGIFHQFTPMIGVNFVVPER